MLFSLPLQQSPFEFVQRWNAIPRKAQSSEYARLLEAIPPLTLPDMITNKLDGIMLTNIIRAIDKQFIPKGEEVLINVLVSVASLLHSLFVADCLGIACVLLELSNCYYLSAHRLITLSCMPPH